MQATPGLAAHDAALAGIRNWAAEAKANREADALREKVRQALIDRSAYSKALSVDAVGAGTFEICTAIEKRYGLLNYPAKAVEAGLNAACDGLDPIAAANKAREELS